MNHQGLLKSISFILMDIEGTTTKISFVKEILFPYSLERLPEFLENQKHKPEVKTNLTLVSDTFLKERGKVPNFKEMIQTLREWVEEDRKHPALKSLQGLIWKKGYEDEAYASHLYEDVLPALKNWQARGIRMGIYSSGSVGAQKLLFRYTICGDLNPYLSHYFDLQMGPKKERDSYIEIAQSLDLPPEKILFLSDVVEELNAAKEAGFQAIHVQREGTPRCDRYLSVTSFSDLNDLENDEG